MPSVSNQQGLVSFKCFLSKSKENKEPIDTTRLNRADINQRHKNKKGERNTPVIVLCATHGDVRETVRKKKTTLNNF